MSDGWVPRVTTEEYRRHEAALFGVDTDKKLANIGASGWDLEVDQRLAALPDFNVLGPPSPAPRPTDYASNELRDQAGPAPAPTAAVAPVPDWAADVDARLANLPDFLPAGEVEDPNAIAEPLPPMRQSFAEFMAAHEEPDLSTISEPAAPLRENQSRGQRLEQAAQRNVVEGVPDFRPGATIPEVTPEEAGVPYVPGVSEFSEAAARGAMTQAKNVITSGGRTASRLGIGEPITEGAAAVQTGPMGVVQAAGDLANLVPGWFAGNAGFSLIREALIASGIVPEDSVVADLAAVGLQLGVPGVVTAVGRRFGPQAAQRVGAAAKAIDDASRQFPALERGSVGGLPDFDEITRGLPLFKGRGPVSVVDEIPLPGLAPATVLPELPPPPTIRGIGKAVDRLSSTDLPPGAARPQIAAGVGALPGQSVAEASTPGQIGNLTLAKFDESLGDILSQAVNRLSPEAVDAARRGEIGEDALRSLASKVGMTTEQFIKRAKPGKAYSGEEMLALDEALSTTAREIQDVSARLTDPSQATDALRAEFAALSMQATGLSRAAVGGRSEAGRALGAMRYLRQSMDSPTRLKRALEMVGDAASDPAIMQRIVTAADDPVELFGLIRDMQKPNFRDRFGTYFRANLLSSPLTQVRNIAGNAGALAFILPERAAAAAVDAARSLVTRAPRERFFGEVPAQAEGLFAGFGMAVRRAGEVLTRGYTAEDAMKLEQAGRFKPFGMGKVGEVIEAPFRALSAGDAFFRTLAESGELWTLAYRRASREGLKGDALRQRAVAIAAEKPADMMEQVAQAGSYRTYTQTLDRYGQWVSGFKNLPGGEFLMPFISTPWNIAKYELERSPAGLLSVGKAIADKKGAGEVADRAGRMLLGSGIGASLYGHALGGNMTAQAPENPTERELFYREGKQPFSIRIGDQWHSYAQFTGWSTVLALTAATADANRRLGTAPTEREAMRIVGEAASVLTEKPFLTGLKNLQEAMESVDKTGKIAEDVARGLVPAASLLGTTARSIDPTMREPEGTAERIQAGVPGLSRQVPARLDAFGQEVQREQSGVESFLNPVQRTSAKDDPIDAELRRLTGDTGDAVGPSPITRTTRIAGQDLDRAQRRALQEINGPMAYDALVRLFSSGAYLRAKNDAERVELVRREMSRVRTRAGAEVSPPSLRGSP